MSNRHRDGQLTIETVFEGELHKAFTMYRNWTPDELKLAFINWTKPMGDERPSRQWTLRERSHSNARMTWKTYYGRTMLAVIQQSRYGGRNYK